MEDSNTPLLSKIVLRLAAYVGAIGVICTAGFTAGAFISNNNSVSIDELNEGLNDQIATAKTFLYKDSIGMANWKKDSLGGNPINSDTSKRPFITIINYSTGKCAIIKNNQSWGKKITAKRNEILLLTFTCRNDGRSEIKGAHLFLSSDLAYQSGGFFLVSAGVLVGNQILKTDSVKIFVERPPSKVLFIRPGILSFDGSKLEEGIAFNTDTGYSAGDIRSNNERSVSVPFIVQ